MPLPDLVAKWEAYEGSGLGARQGQPDSAALHGEGARSVVVQRVFDS